jgi:hypothetical protein
MLCIIIKCETNTRDIVGIRDTRTNNEISLLLSFIPVNLAVIFFIILQEI